jgi:putative heme iron utilization protein
MANSDKAATPLPGAMPDRLPEHAIGTANFDPVATAKVLLRATRCGTLATIDRNTGHPFASLVNVGTDFDGSPLILISRLATHTANLELDGRASLLLASAGKGDPLAHPRLTVLGSFVQVPRGHANEPGIRRRFLARHPKSELYAGFADFCFWRLTVTSAHLNGGFARAADLKAADILTDVSGADDLIAAEASAVAHMNADHAAAVQLYAKLAGGEDMKSSSGSSSGPWSGSWRITGIDPEGLDLAYGDATLRLAFPRPVTTAQQLRMTIVDLAAQARARAGGKRGN